MKSYKSLLRATLIVTLLALVSGCTAIRGGRIKSTRDDYKRSHYIKLCKQYSNLNEIIRLNSGDHELVLPRPEPPEAVVKKAEPVVIKVLKGQEDSIAKLNAELAALKQGIKLAAPEAVRKSRRNQILFDLKWIADYNYNEMITSLQNGRQTFGFASDMAVIGVSTAGALTGGTAVKSILSATAAGVTGMRSSVDQNFYQEKTTELLMKKMDLLRAARWAVLEANLHKEADIYSLRQGLDDLEKYEDAGSLKRALEALITDQAANASVGGETPQQVLDRLKLGSPQREHEMLLAQLKALPDESSKRACKAFGENMKALLTGDEQKPFSDLIPAEGQTYAKVEAAIKTHLAKASVEDHARKLLRVNVELQLVLAAAKQ